MPGQQGSGSADAAISPPLSKNKTSLLASGKASESPASPRRGPSAPRSHDKAPTRCRKSRGPAEDGAASSAREGPDWPACPYGL